MTLLALIAANGLAGLDAPGEDPNPAVSCAAAALYCLLWDRKIEVPLSRVCARLPEGRENFGRGGSPEWGGSRDPRTMSVRSGG